MWNEIFYPVFQFQSEKGESHFQDILNGLAVQDTTKE